MNTLFTYKGFSTAAQVAVDRHIAIPQDERSMGLFECNERER